MGIHYPLALDCLRSGTVEETGNRLSASWDQVSAVIILELEILNQLVDLGCCLCPQVPHKLGSKPDDAPLG